jgi:Flp pilus assembly secretin CpaC
MRLLRASYCLLSLAAVCFNIALASGASADEQNITVYADRAKLLKIEGRPSAVVVGNPMIADVTIQSNNMLAVHGRHFGNTNLIILDNQGNELASLLINVIRPQANNVEMFKGGAEGKIVGKYSYTCSPECESVVMPGDDNDYNASIAGQISTKSKEALSSAQGQ